MNTTGVAFKLASSSDEDRQEDGEANESEADDILHGRPVSTAGDIDGEESDDTGEGFLQGVIRPKPDMTSPSNMNQGPSRSTTQFVEVPVAEEDTAAPHDYEEGRPTKTKVIHKPTCPLCKRAFATASEAKYHVEAGVCSRDLLGIGRKTRQSLQSAQSGRAVIQRVDPAAIEQGKRTSFTIPIPSPRVAKKQRRSAPDRPYKQREALDGLSSSNVDRWMPGIAALPSCTHQTRSDIVQLHGLPTTATPETVVRFFAGLSVRKVWLLPPFANHVVPWDADHTIHRKRGFHVERSPATLRVLAKFQDAATAELAACRSGELMRVPFASSNDSDGGTDELVECEAAVAVTQWRKDDASFVLENSLAIDARSKMSLEKAFDETQASLKPGVTNIIWKRMIRDLSLAIRPLEIRDAIGESSGITALDGPDHQVFLGPAYDRAVQHHTCMVTEYQRLLLAQQCVFDPTLFESDSVYRLTTKAIGFLKQDIADLDQQLVRSRRWRLLQSPAFKTMAVS